MQTNYFLILLCVISLSCNNNSKPIVNSEFTDSLITNYSESGSAKIIKGNFGFWKTRMDSLPDNFVNGPEYGAALSSLFHLSGNINDLIKADSLYKQSIKAYKGEEPGLYRTLAYLAITQHQFNRADSLLKEVVKVEGQSMANAFLDFDITFEKGDYRRAKNLLSTLKNNQSYGYLFRKSKFEHYDGSLDTAIANMLGAAELAGENRLLKQTALSNAADLFMHQGDLKKANSLYVTSIKLDAADLHSIMGLGWIALINDKNDTLAEKLFQLVQNYTQSPDVLLKLMHVYEFRGDTLLQKKTATEFATIVSDSKYGNMYSKYLIDLFTGILNEPSKAVIISKRELINRSTPQTYAWYVWSLFKNNELEKANQFYKSYVSSKPLEGLELFYMGKMMEATGNKFNAQQFFKAAWKNRYDLSPAKQKFLKENLE